MSTAALVEIIHAGHQESWSERNKTAFHGLFGAQGGRYPESASKSVALRAPAMSGDAGVTFAAYIPHSSPSSGAYGGVSFVIFPVPGKPALFGLVVGTQGLSPDEAILGRPGHARKAQAICSWLNREYGGGNFVAWAKQDPTRTDVAISDPVKGWSQYKNIFDAYGKEVYALYCPSENRGATEAAVTAFLDLLFEERGYGVLTRWQANCRSIRDGWFKHLMPGIERAQVEDLLAQRRYVVVQGPPGTGKTRMAVELLQQAYGGHGRSIQFHPNTTYENFIGGLAPAHADGGLGFRFDPVPGFLMEAAAEALKDPSRDYLLHIDEINRADLGKILGEAIFLLETSSDSDRKIELAYNFGPPFHRTFWIPKNLHILGTMNSADRSIAILDVAVRRRFAFVSLWPRLEVVEEFGCPTMRAMFVDLLSIFIEHASDDSFGLIPGHSYFLEADEMRARQHLQTNLAPLLEEYLAQGYVGGFAEPIRGYLQKLKSL
jgi:5-methylcytosine-specific restriction enzyme B